MHQEAAMTHAAETPSQARVEPNRAQRDEWNESQPEYDAWAGRWEDVWAPFGKAMFDAARLQPGERVLDIGCGYGTTTIEAAERVAPSGGVLGVDISAAMLEPARQRVAASGLDNIELQEGDAQVHPFDAGSFDAVISRFGTMFFDNPAWAFGNIAHGLRNDGRMVFVCWQDPLECEWIATALGAAVAALGQAPNLGTPGSPGPFAFADGDRLTDVIVASGLRDVALESLIRPQLVGTDADDAAKFVISIAEEMQVFAGAPDEVKARAADALRAAYEPYAGPRGVVMDGACWLVSARR
jgi:SAM-dependent methyltransferase